MKKFIKIILACVITIIGLSMVTSTASAKSKRHYVTTPKRLRGTWYTVRNGYVNQGLRITKYTLETSTIKLSSMISDDTTISGRKYSTGGVWPDLFVATKKSPKGYWNIGPRWYGTLKHLKVGTKDNQGNATLKEYYYGYTHRYEEDPVEVLVTQKFYSEKSLKPHVKALRAKYVATQDDLRVTE
ncbi:hypothetical protein [Levilactobacillus brevis]|uniref:hypothetical protein n=1 Tax=Levilactobacillus brevis TaxID=1580 RepID=UPI001118ACA0|nr:hypothetical protein [Levilactobacillus brevis]